MPYTISRRQLTELALALSDRRGEELRGEVDARVHPRAPDLARLDALAARAVERCAAFPNAAEWLAVEVEAAARLDLRPMLSAGLEYDEPLVAALLDAAAAMGSEWPVDRRLIGGAGIQSIPLRALLESDAERRVGLVKARLESAVSRAQLLHAGACAALSDWLDEGGVDQSLHRLNRAVFGRHDAPEAEAFKTEAATALAAIGNDDADLRLWCLAGDLSFGKGRMNRIAYRAAAAGRSPLHDVQEACRGLVQDADH